MGKKIHLVLSIVFCLFSFGIFAKVSYTNDYAQIKKRLPTYTSKDLDGLIFRRQAKSPESFMDALGLHQVFEKNTAYTLSKQGLVKAASLTGVKKVPEDFRIKAVHPNSVIIRGKWITTLSQKDSKEEKISNILGKNSRLVITTNGKKIHIPIEEASSEKLSYYGAVAIPMGEKVIFPQQEEGYPIWAMSLGKTYAKDYIMSEKAGGWYLEWHTDRPHFHMPLSQDANGFYLLGKKLNKNHYELTAFKIPYGVAVFTKRGAIHSDSGLTGKRWLVGYTTSKHYSTALLRNLKNEYIEVVAK